jgi:tetratricopeptide (TPR) repeat protein
MRSINLRPLLLIASLSLLGACSTLELSTPHATVNGSANTEVKVVNDEAPESEAVLDPLTLKAMNLRGEPKQYQGNSPLTPASAKAQFKLALALKRQGEWAEAEDKFKQLSLGYPTLSGPWVQLAELSLLQAKDTEPGAGQKQALSYLEKALSLKPDNHFAHNRLAALLRQQGKFKQAEEHYARAIASWPAFAEAYLNKGILYDLYLGDKQQALDHYQLYQTLVDTPDRRVKGWIADLNRQIHAAQQEAAK